MDRTAVEKMLAAIQPINQYKEEFVSLCKKPRVRMSTGIPSFDRKLNGGLSDELYILAAATSTGKSAFLMSLAQKVAESGTDVLYFALEMSRKEFVARAISSISYEHHRLDKSAQQITAADVLYWSCDKSTKNYTRMPYSVYEGYAEEYFSRYGDHLNIIEGGINGWTVKDIANVAALYKEQRSPQVVVFVDYMQLIKADPGDRTQADRKTKMDIIAATLKTLASQIGMPVITISSISRKAYGGRVGESDLKESGDLEYTGGILLGWNWLGVTDASDKMDRQKEKQACRQRGYRRMALDILKYRNSEKDSTVYLKYYPAYNYFEEDDGSKTVTDNVQTPFTGAKPVIIA